MLIKGFMKVTGLIEELFAVDAIGNVYSAVGTRKTECQALVHFDTRTRIWLRTSVARLAGAEFIGNYEIPVNRRD